MKFSIYQATKSSLRAVGSIQILFYTYKILTFYMLRKIKAADALEDGTAYDHRPMKITIRKLPVIDSLAGTVIDMAYGCCSHAASFVRDAGQVAGVMRGEFE